MKALVDYLFISAFFNNKVLSNPNIIHCWN